MGYQKTTHKVNVYRLARTGNNEDYSGTPVRSDLDVGIFPAGTDVIATYPGEGNFTLYEGFIYEQVSLQSGDKLKVGTEEWIVQGVPQVFSLPELSYQRVILQKLH